MSLNPPRGMANDTGKGLSLLSLDAGGPQGISQLQILISVMDKAFHQDRQKPEKRPVDVFAAIGGVGTGGLIAIFLVVLKMTAKEALKEFTDFVVKVFKDVSRDPTKQTEILKKTIDGILEKYGIGKDATLVSSIQTAAVCKLMVPIMYKNHIGVPSVLRNYIPSREQPTNLTIAEAMLATCATPPLFNPITISKDFASFEYVGGDLGLSNPTREIIAEAHRVFGDETTVACLLSIGCGHRGVNAVPAGPNSTTWMDFLERLALDSERTALDIGTQMSQLTLYYRLSVKYGLEKDHSQTWRDPGIIATHTTNYLNDLDVVALVDRCVDTIKQGDGFATLEQLRHSGGARVLFPPLPPLTPNWVERKLPMEFIEKALFETDRTVKLGSKRIVVTGIGGCGKTQLIRNFIEKYKHLFASTVFIDGSSRDTMRRDIVRHVRALGGVHSQKSFDESMAFLSQALHDGERLLIIDNVDDPALDLDPFLPRWLNGVVIITSRNHSRGQLNPATHLQLDVMTLEESVELLVRGSGQQWPPAASNRHAAIAVAEELGCHPIALVQAISYMYNTGCSPKNYITLLRSHRDRLLRDHPATSQIDMRYKTAFAAFNASYDILPSKAQNFWHLLSFFSCQKFPVEIVTLGALDAFSTDHFSYLARGGEFELGKGCLTEIFCSSGGWDPLELHSILGTLRNHSLITMLSAENATLLQMHPLIHEWGRLLISEGHVHRFKAAAIRLLCCGASEDNYSMMQYLFSHVQALFSAWPGLHANDAASFGFILAQSGMYAMAAKLEEISHKMAHRILGSNHLNTITASAKLAVTYSQLGRYSDAEMLQKSILQRRIQLLGVDHTDTIKVSAELGITCSLLGHYAEAEKLQVAVLQDRKNLLGVDHSDTVRACAELAVTYSRSGQYAKAEELEIEVLRRRQQQLGEDHPDTIWASERLAITHHDLGRYAQAVELQRKVAWQRTQLLGVEHPHTIRSLANLSRTLFDLRYVAEAEVLQTEVLRLRTTVLGERHPDTVRAMNCLAYTYHATQRQSEATSLAQSACQIAFETLGDDHPIYWEVSEFLYAHCHM